MIQRDFDARKRYTRPELHVYGSLTELTRGASGHAPDFIFTGVLKINNNNPGCTNNVSSGGCVTWG